MRRVNIRNSKENAAMYLRYFVFRRLHSCEKWEKFREGDVEESGNVRDRLIESSIQRDITARGGRRWKIIVVTITTYYVRRILSSSAVARFGIFQFIFIQKYTRSTSARGVLVCVGIDTFWENMIYYRNRVSTRLMSSENYIYSSDWICIVTNAEHNSSTKCKWRVRCKGVKRWSAKSVEINSIFSRASRWRKIRSVCVNARVPEWHECVEWSRKSLNNIEKSGQIV